MFEHVPESQPTQKPQLSKEDLEEIQIPIQKGKPVEIAPPPPQQADLKKIPGHKKLWIILSVVIGVVVVGVGGVFAAHLSGIINVPLVDTILKRDTTDLATLTSKIGEIHSAQSDVELVFAVEPQTIDAKSVDNGLFGGFIDFLPTDINLKLNFSSFMSSNEEDPSGTLALSGTYTSGGTSLSASLDARVIDGSTYIRANTLPSIPSFSFDEVIGKWILLSSAEDIENQLGQFQLPISALDTTALNTQDAQQVIQSLLTQAYSTGFVNLSKRVSVDDIDGVTFNHYTLTFDKTRAKDFIQSFLVHERDICASQKDCVISSITGSDFSKQTDDDIATLAQTVSTDADASAFVDLITDTFSYDVWIAQDGSAYQLKLSVLIDGRSQSEQLAGKQIRLEITSRMSHINEEPQVEKPTTDLTTDDLSRIFSGYSTSEWDIVQQLDRIRALQDALSQYKNEHTTYPANLSLLPGNVNVTDIFTNKPFVYALDGSAYTIQYQIKKIDGTTADATVIEDAVVVGTNTADKFVLSREAESSRDTDGDGLTGAQELSYKTNPLEEDTDADGTNDFDEIQVGTDPLDSESNPTQDIGVDTDGDGLTDKQEELYGTNPKLKDTDLDGFSDKNEIDSGYNPLSASNVKTYGMRVSDTDWIRGASDAKVTVVSFCVFSDDTIPCNDYYTYLKTLLVTYPTDVRIVYKQFSQEISSSALECAGVQGKFFDMHDKMLSEGENYTVARMNVWAESLGLDTTAFTSCLNNHEQDKKVVDDVLYTDLLGVKSVPATIVNGTLITGGQTSVITSTIEEKMDQLQ
ncbi:MAG: thioredoxin domain-containing protein [Patescibacteria group bacterium]|jgi:protein-disulfide isomerase